MPQQAYSPSYRPQSRGGYQQPRQGSSKLYYTDGTKIPGARIDGRVQRVTMMGGPDEGPLAPRGNQFVPTRPAPTRQDNINAARADGTFDMKRAAYNAANKSSFMDESGKIGPKAPLPTGNPSNERVPVASTTPTAAPAAKPEMMGPRKPATFEGKSRAEWFGDAAQRQKQGNAYSNEALAQSKPMQPTSNRLQTGIARVDAAGPGPSAKPSANTAFKPAPLPGPSTAGTKEPPRPFSSPAPIVAPAGSPVAASPIVASKKATTPVAPAPAPSNAPAAAAPPASSMTTAAVRPPPVSQAVKNPQGMSARMGADQPSPMPKMLADPIGTVGRGIASAADAVGSAITSTAAKNPQGLASKLTRLFSPKKPRQVASK